MRSSVGIASLPLLVAALMAIVIASVGGLLIYTSKQNQLAAMTPTPLAVDSTEFATNTPLALPTKAPAATIAPQPTKASVITTSVSGQSDWGSYRNVGQKVSFRYPYPQGTKILEDGFENPDFPQWYRVVLRFPSEIGIPLEDLAHLTFEINPEGYGPIFADEVYTIAEAPGGTIKIISEKKVDYSASEENYGDDGTRTIVVNSFQHSNGNVYYWRFTVPEDDGDRYEPLFKEILGTFTFER